jgi:type II secretory pathway component PulF
MERMEQYHMTKKEMRKLQVVEKLIDKSVTLKEACQILELSSRQLLRLKKGVRIYGALSVVHKNRAREPNNAVGKSLCQKIINLGSFKKYC